MSTDANPSAPSRRKLWLKGVLILGLALAGILFSRLPGVREALEPAGRQARFLREHELWTAPLFVALTATLISLGVPRLLFCPIAGAAFGFWVGLTTSTSGTMLAYLISFLWIRGRGPNTPAPPTAHPAFRLLARQPGLAGVIALRLLPVPGLLGTSALALSPVRLRDYLLGSLVGILPQAAPLVLLGAGGLSGDPRGLTGLAVLVVIVILASSLLPRRWLNRAVHEPKRV